MTDPWRDRCRRLAPQILRGRGWQLVPEDALSDFIAQVCRAIVEGVVQPRPNAPPEKTVRRATIHCYCHELYQASGEEGTLRQRLAFEELGRYAQSIAWRYTDNLDTIEECVQRALIRIWEKRDQIRSPGSILRWVESIVDREIQGYWKEKHREHEVPMSQWNLPPGAGEDDAIMRRFWETLAAISPPDDTIIERQLREQLWAEVQRVLANNPRYQAVIVGYYLYDLNLPTLAEMLQTSVRNVYVLKSRALRKLRADRDFIARFADALEALPERGKR